jgi:hypothetical protein
MQWGQMTENSFVHSVQLTLNAMEEDYTYTYLMGISGAAFRFHFHPDWCPSTTDATTGFDVSKTLFYSLGYKAELIEIDDKSFLDIQRLYKKIIENINRGIPIVAINLKVCPEWGIITGYTKTKPGIICRTYFDEGDNYSIAEHAPWLSYFINKEKMNPPESKILFYNSLDIAVKLAETPYFNEYTSGFTAFQVWKNLLINYVQESRKFDRSEVNLSLLHTFIDARKAAANYLTEMINMFPIENGLMIINNYLKELQLLQELHEKVLPGFNDNASAWTSDILKKQIQTIENVIKLERENIELIKEALN